MRARRHCWTTKAVFRARGIGSKLRLCNYAFRGSASREREKPRELSAGEERLRALAGAGRKDVVPALGITDEREASSTVGDACGRASLVYLNG